LGCNFYSLKGGEDMAEKIKETFGIDVVLGTHEYK